MEKFAIITGSLGVIFGGYGAWRSWRTDRALRILGKKWEIVASRKGEYFFFNRQSRPVYGVAISAPDGLTLKELDMPEVIRPNESAHVLVLRGWWAKSEQFEVTWYLRSDLSGDPLIWRGRLPGGDPTDS